MSDWFYSALLAATFGLGALAQAVTDPIGGGSGWVGAGLLGAVLAWLLLKHLPAKDQQMADLIGQFTMRVQELYNRMEAALQQQRADFRVELAEERKSRLEQHQANMAALERLGDHLDKLRDEITALSHQVRGVAVAGRGGTTSRDTEVGP